MQTTGDFKYGITKCLIVVFNELKNAFLRANRFWNFGYSSIEEGVEYKHLGVICDKHMSIDKNVKNACNKIVMPSLIKISYLILSNLTLKQYMCHKMVERVDEAQTVQVPQNGRAS